MEHTLAISVRQPWAWLIVTGHKDIENRTWDTRHRGPLLIHAGTYRPSEGELLDIEEAYGVTIDRAALKFGGIVGKVDLKDCATEHASQWYLGGDNFAWVLANPVPCDFVPCRGRLGLFRPA